MTEALTRYSLAILFVVLLLAIQPKTAFSNPEAPPEAPPTTNCECTQPTETIKEQLESTETVEGKKEETGVAKTPKAIEKEPGSAEAPKANKERLGSANTSEANTDLLVDRVTRLKSLEWDEKDILEHLYQDAVTTKHANPQKDAVIGYVRFNDKQLSKLAEHRLSEKFVLQVQGLGEYTSLGMAALWMDRSREVAYAPMFRIFLESKATYKPLAANMKRFGSSEWYAFLLGPSRWDINVGYTFNKTKTNDNKDVRYFLMGLACNLNRAVSLNFGGAIATLDRSYNQFYWGITVDTELFKKFGFKD